MYIGEDRHLTHEALALYVDGLKLHSVEKVTAEIRDHAADCQRCRQAVMELESLVDDRVYEDLETHPTFGVVGRRRGLPVIYRIAASLLVLLGIGVIAYMEGLFNGHQEKQGSVAVNQAAPVAASPDTSKGHMRAPVPPSSDFTASMEPSPNLESVVNSTLRSEEVRVVSPAIGAIVRGDVVFQWRTTVKAPFTLKVLNNREFEEQSITLNTRRYVLRSALPAGLHYWKLEAGGELLFVGKFVVGSNN